MRYLILLLLFPHICLATPLTGKEGRFCGRVFLSVTQEYPEGVIDKIPREKIEADGSKIEGNKIIGKPHPMQGVIARLKDQLSFSDVDGYFSFNAIPTDVTEGQFFQQMSDKHPIGSFLITELVAKGTEPKIILLKPSVNVEDLLNHMD